MKEGIVDRLRRVFMATLFFVLCAGVYGIAEEITLTTYYPAPYGAYEELSTTNNTYLATDSGSVGIGTSSPNEELHIHDASSADSFLQFTQQSTGVATGDGFFVGVDSGNNSRLRNKENTDMLFSTNDATRMTIESGGNVDIANNVDATSYSVGGVPGASGTFTTTDGKTVTVVNGIVTSII